MKHFYQTFLILSAILFASVPASAYDFESDGMYFNILSTSEMTCEITYGENKYSGDFKIPESVTFSNRELKVIRVGGGAFADCKNLTSVNIPNSVTEIGYRAFYSCSSLTKVTIPNSVTEIDNQAFYGCINLTSITIPNSVTAIREEAFGSCSSLTAVNIPNSVTHIGDSAFESCSSLTEVTIPNSITYIKKRVFYGCNSLTTVTIPNSVTEIGNQAFYSCSSLTKVTIPNSVTEIGNQAFYGCINLTSITIPNSVKTIREEAFKNCTNITTLVIESSEKYLYLIKNSFENTQITNLTVGRRLSHSYSYNPFFSFTDTGLNKISNLTILDNTGDINFLFANNLSKTLTTLTIGENNTDYPYNLSSYNLLKTITLKDPTPQKRPTFTNMQYASINVYVPKGSLNTYQNDSGWKDFWNIYELEESGINEIISDAIKTEVARYNLQGHRVSADYRGIIIVRYSDGTVEKVINE